MPSEFGPWQTVYDRFRQWRDAGVFQALMDGMISEAAGRGQVDLSLVGVDSTVARAHQDAAGMRLGEQVLTCLEKAAEESKGAARRGGSRPSSRSAGRRTRNGSVGVGSGGGVGRG